MINSFAEETFQLSSEPDHPSLSANVPKGWSADYFRDSLSGRRYKRAVDPDGFLWYWTDDRWLLNVPYFRRTARCARDASDDVAICDHLDGSRSCHITEKGTIHLSTSRVVRRSQWTH